MDHSHERPQKYMTSKYLAPRQHRQTERAGLVPSNYPGSLDGSVLQIAATVKRRRSGIGATNKSSFERNKITQKIKHTIGKCEGK